MRPDYHAGKLERLRTIKSMDEPPGLSPCACSCTGFSAPGWVSKPRGGRNVAFIEASVA